MLLNASKILYFYLPIISTTRNVSMIGSITSSGMRVNLLFCMFNVSSEFKFSNAIAGNTLMLFEKTKKKITTIQQLNSITQFRNLYRKLTHFFVNLRMLSNRRNQQMHLLV